MAPAHDLGVSASELHRHGAAEASGAGAQPRATEFSRDIPFVSQRYFVVFDVPRGEHAHYRCHQFLVCAKGQVSVVADDGVRREAYGLDSPGREGSLLVRLPFPKGRRESLGFASPLLLFRARARPCRARATHATRCAPETTHSTDKPRAQARSAAVTSTFLA